MLLNMCGDPSEHKDPGHMIARWLGMYSIHNCTSPEASDVPACDDKGRRESPAPRHCDLAGRLPRSAAQARPTESDCTAGYLIEREEPPSMPEPSDACKMCRMRVQALGEMAAQGLDEEEGMANLPGKPGSAVRRIIIAGTWVAFCQECQKSSCG